MGSITTAPDFLDALRAALILRSGMSGVACYSAPVEAEALGQKCLVLCTEAASAEYEMPTAGRRECFETYTVDGFIWATAPGAGETVIGTARDNAFDVLEEVHDYLDSLTTTAATIAAIVVDDARITGWSMEQWPEQGVRHCTVKFTLECHGRFTPA